MPDENCWKFWRMTVDYIPPKSISIGIFRSLPLKMRSIFHFRLRRIESRSIPLVDHKEYDVRLFCYQRYTRFTSATRYCGVYALYGGENWIVTLCRTDFHISVTEPTADTVLKAMRTECAPGCPRNFASYGYDRIHGWHGAYALEIKNRVADGALGKFTGYGKRTGKCRQRQHTGYCRRAQRVAAYTFQRIQDYCIDECIGRILVAVLMDFQLDFWVCFY